RESAYCDGRERGIVAQLAGGIPQVGADGLDGVLPTVGAHLLARHGGGAKLQASRAPRLFRRGSTLRQCRRRLFKVVARFIGKISVRGRSVGERAESTRELSSDRHPLYASAFKSRAMADARRSQSAVSNSSCFLPARVSS